MSPRKRQVTYSTRPNRAARAAHAKGERAFKTYDTKGIRPKKSKAPIVIAIILLIVIIAALAACLSYCVHTMEIRETADTALLPEGEEVEITVLEGSGAKAIAEQLKEAGLIAQTTDFTSRVSALGVETELQSGTYTFTGGTSVDDIISLLQLGPGSTTATLTIPEGYTLAATANAVAAATDGRISADDFTSAASDASVYASDFAFLEEAGDNSLEGFLFPKTYAVSSSDTADSIIRMMLKQFVIETSSLDWSYPESCGLSLYDAVTLASIVEKESSADQTVREKVAAVFYNRLDNMDEPNFGYLQSDATSAYEVGHDPSADEVHEDTPYSTYTHQGLPPTPICSPSLSCLEAVCSPDEDALGKVYFFYFDTDDSGETTYYFSETYEEHMETFSDGSDDSQDFDTSDESQNEEDSDTSDEG